MFVVKFGKPIHKHKRIIGKSKTYEGAWVIMTKNLEERGISPFYYRTRKLEDNKTEQIDYGSWSEFFYIVKERG